MKQLNERSTPKMQLRLTIFGKALGPFDGVLVGNIDLLGVDVLDPC